VTTFDERLESIRNRLKLEKSWTRSKVAALLDEAETSMANRWVARADWTLDLAEASLSLTPDASPR